MTNYRGLDGPALLATVGTDAVKWAEAFCQINGEKATTPDLMETWFANAMMAMYDEMRARAA